MSFQHRAVGQWIRDLSLLLPDEQQQLQRADVQAVLLRGHWSGCHLHRRANARDRTAVHP